MTIDGEAVTRILDVDGTLDRNIDRNKLAARLNMIASLHRADSARGAPATRRRLAEQIKATAGRLVGPVEEYFAGLELFLPEPRRYSIELQRLIADVNYLESIADTKGGFSAFETTVHRLRKAYEAFFKRHTGYRKGTYTDADETVSRDEAIRSPFIDFAEAALKEMSITNGGEPFSRSAIADAMTKLNRAEKEVKRTTGKT